MSFKEYIASDIKSVFMNTNEYADMVLLNMGAGAKEITVVIDNEQLTHNANMQELNGGTGDIFFYVDKSEFVEKFGKQPREGEGIIFNTRPCTIQNVSDKNGVLSITLSFNVG